jgi:hypothetical protein
MWGVHHLAGTPHLANDLPTGVTDTTVAFPGRLLLSLFCKEKGKGWIFSILSSVIKLHFYNGLCF